MTSSLRRLGAGIRFESGFFQRPDVIAQIKADQLAKSVPAPLRAIETYLWQAAQLERFEPVIAHYCRCHAASEATRLCKQIELAGVESEAFLEVLLGRIEQDKVNLGESITTEKDTCLQFALAVFKRVQAEPVTVGLAQDYHSVSVLLQVCQQFGDLSAEASEIMTYAASRVASLHEAAGFTHCLALKDSSPTVTLILLEEFRDNAEFVWKILDSLWPSDGWRAVFKSVCRGYPKGCDYAEDVMEYYPNGVVVCRASFEVWMSLGGGTEGRTFAFGGDTTCARARVLASIKENGLRATYNGSDLLTPLVWHKMSDASRKYRASQAKR